jgi:FAD/FMN-containing dehydrogenase
MAPALLDGVMPPADDAVRTASARTRRSDGAARTRSAYADATLARLAAVKARFDPDNFFRRNQNIAPAAAHLPRQEQTA